MQQRIDEEKKTFRISVIIPCFNCEDYLSECASSLFAAADDGTELIFVDDGSTDGTGEILRRLALKGAIVLAQKNKGPGAARNLGMDRAVGDYIMFADADDLVSADYISSVRTYIETFGEIDQVCMKISADSGRLLQRGELPPKDKCSLTAAEAAVHLLNVDLVSCRKLLSEGYALHGPVAKAYKAEIIRANGIRFPEELRWGEDICFNLQFLNCSSEVGYLPVFGYFYRKVGQSLVHSYYPRKSEQISRFVELCSTYVRRGDPLQEDAFDHLAVKQYIYALQYDFCHEKNREPQKKREREAWKLLEESPCFGGAVNKCDISTMTPAAAVCLYLIRKRWFGILGTIIRTYSRVSS